jgi:streptogramin lyase
MRYHLEDLGSKAFGNLWRAWRMVRDPNTGLEYAMGALTRTGFAIIDPRTRSSRVIRCEQGMNCAEGIGQAPNGDLYVADYGFPNPNPTLCVWDWKGLTARVVAQHKCAGVMHLDVGADGNVYLPDYQSNTLHRYRPADGVLDDMGTFAEYADHVRNVEAGRDGLIYLQLYVNKPNVGMMPVILALNPKTGERLCIDSSAIAPAQPDPATLLKDAHGRVLLSTTHWGNRVWHELRDAKLHRIDQSLLAMTGSLQPLTFSDGSYIAGVDENIVTFVDAKRTITKFTIDREEAPLRIFSVTSGGGKIWCGTFMPLTLGSYDVKTGETKGFGNITRTEGEPYSMVFSHDKLYLACYVNAHVVRFDPRQPIVKNDTIQANPGTLGTMKPVGLPVHRPHGKAVDPQGIVYFAALGGYGCIDSAIARVDPKTDRMTTWTFPATEITAIAYHVPSASLLVAERRVDDKWLRLTRISPNDGTAIDSTPFIEDGGQIHSLLTSDGPEGNIVYGVHGWRAAIFAYDLSQKKITATLPEVGLGHHLHNVLVDGPDGRIWGVTSEAVYAVTRDMKKIEALGRYTSTINDAGNRFGACFGEDGNLYFPNGASLMRLRVEK